MLTVVETPEFQKQAAKVWSNDERLDFISWLAENPEAGDVVPGAGGARKVRWQVQGRGKRGGVRVIYVNFTADEFVLLLAIYTKSDKANMLAHEIERKTK